MQEKMFLKINNKYTTVNIDALYRFVYQYFMLLCCV